VEAHLRISLHASGKSACAERTAGLPDERDVSTGQAVSKRYKVSRHSQLTKRILVLKRDGMNQDVRQRKHSRWRGRVYRLSACQVEGGISFKTFCFALSPLFVF
jgi:hypothetical protein